MSFTSSLKRAVTAPRRRRDDTATADVADRRHPTMVIDLTPVHGRHCICDRCETAAPPASRASA